jgi:hypothetical protein
MSNYPVDNCGMIRTLNYRIGDVVGVHHRDDGHRLPEGLPEGAQVAVVGIVQVSRLVEWEGELFEIHMANIDPPAAAA